MEERWGSRCRGYYAGWPQVRWSSHIYKVTEAMADTARRKNVRRGSIAIVPDSEVQSIWGRLASMKPNPG